MVPPNPRASHGRRARAGMPARNGHSAARSARPGPSGRPGSRATKHVHRVHRGRSDRSASIRRCVRSARWRWRRATTVNATMRASRFRRPARNRPTSRTRRTRRRRRPARRSAAGDAVRGRTAVLSRQATPVAQRSTTVVTPTALAAVSRERPRPVRVSRKTGATRAMQPSPASRLSPVRKDRVGSDAPAAGAAGVVPVAPMPALPMVSSPPLLLPSLRRSRNGSSLCQRTCSCCWCALPQS